MSPGAPPGRGNEKQILSLDGKKRERREKVGRESGERFRRRGL